MSNENEMTAVLLGVERSMVAASGNATNIDLVLAPKGDGVISVSNAIISDVAPPVVDSDAANKEYVDDALAALRAEFIELHAEIGTMHGSITEIEDLGKATFNDEAEEMIVEEKTRVDLIGDKGKDTITGMTGVITSVYYDSDGVCNQIALCPGEGCDSVLFDVQRVEITPVPDFAAEPCENIKRWTFELWHYLNSERMWEAGDRPVLCPRTGDLLFMTPLDSYCRERHVNNDDNHAFQQLSMALSIKQIVPVVMHNGSISRRHA